MPRIKKYLLVKNYLLKIFLSVLVINSNYSYSQENSNPLIVSTKKEKGIEVLQKDSLFSLRFQFRMQNRAGYLSKSEEDFTPEQMEFRVRRLRMAMRGFVANPKLTYYVQLSFSRGDMDWEANRPSNINTSPNAVRDAIFYYEPVKNLKFGLGQTKLPGNRQRVTSSGNLQFADRSIVNSTFTIDRDFGFFATFDQKHFRIKGAVTSGEGRNSTKSDKGLNYTGRIEILPFGKFTGDNEDWEGDLLREAKPKICIAGNYNYNVNAVRTGGTLGDDLYSSVNLSTIQADLLFKYKGFSLLQEFSNRTASNNITVDSKDPSKIKSVYTGFGLLSQVSYNFKNNIEIACRLAVISPEKSLFDNAKYTSLNEKRQEQLQLGVTKYIYGHRLKLQGNLLYHISKDLRNVTQKQQLGAIFQVEIGI